MRFFSKQLAPAGLLAATALAFPPTVASAQDPGTIWTYIPDPHTPVAIDADTLSVNSRNQTATFSGHVLLSDGWVRMHCIRVIVYYDNSGSTLGQVYRIECEPDYVHLID